MQNKKQQSELAIEQQTGSKLGKEYVKVVYRHPAYLISMQSTSCEMPGWNQDCWEKYQQVKEVSEKAGLKFNIKKKVRSWQLVPWLYGK